MGPLADPGQRALQVLQRVRVREPQIALAAGAERRARERGDAGLVKDPLLHRR